MKNIGPDFHMVQLTEDGAALANGAPLRVSNGRISVLFPAGGSAVKIARYEWDMLLRDHASIDGKKLFCIAPVPTPVPGPASPVAPVTPTAAPAKAEASADSKEKV